MDKKVFVRELKNIFLTINKDEEIFAKVPLSEATYGGLYHSGIYIVNIRPNHYMEGASEVGLSLFHMLRDKLDDEKFSYVYTLRFHNRKDESYPENGDILLLDDEEKYD